MTDAASRWRPRFRPGGGTGGVRGASVVAAALLLTVCLAACWWEQGGRAIQIDNSTDSAISVVHRADDGTEVLIDAGVQAHAGAHDYLALRLCTSGVLIARTVDGNREIARRTTSGAEPDLCGIWRVVESPAPATPTPSALYDETGIAFLRNYVGSR